MGQPIGRGEPPADHQACPSVLLGGRVVGSLPVQSSSPTSAFTRCLALGVDVSKRSPSQFYVGYVDIKLFACGAAADTRRRPLQPAAVVVRVLLDILQEALAALGEHRDNLSLSLLRTSGFST